jgi:predicted anti-sigma-YlaC factor YlaD
LEAHWENWREGKAPAALEEHLRGCAHCRELAAELAHTSSWLALLQQEPPEASPAFWPRLREQIEERERGRDFWAALGWAAGRAALALTVLVLALTVGWSGRLPTPR